MPLADILRAAGLRVAEVDGWRTRARPGAFDAVGIIVHHTAGRNDLGTCVHGRPDLTGPLCNLYFDRDAPFTVSVVSAGVANHAGKGSGRVLDEVRRGAATGPSAAGRRLADTVGGNASFYGLECENLGTGEAWPAGQLEAMARAAAAICRHHGWSAGHVIGHLEWTARKIDPRGFAMSDFRAAVARLLAPAAPPDPAAKRCTVFNPPLVLPPIKVTVADPGGGVWAVGVDGSVWALEGARGCRGVNGRNYWGPRRVGEARYVGGDPAIAGKLLEITATTGERYHVPDGLPG